MSDDREEPVVIMLLGLVILAVIVLLLAYAHEAAGECLRMAVAGGRHFWEAPSRMERIAAGSAAAIALYGVLWLLHRIFDLFRKPLWAIAVVIIGAVIAGLIPPDELFPELCRFF